MALDTLKCNNCNVVISEVLCYIQYKLDVIDTESLKKMCDSTFSEEEIEYAKKLLFESVTTKTHPLVTRRHGNQPGGKKMRNLEDIICFFKEVDPDSIPVFVARDLQKLPPTSIDHIDCVTLLKDVIKMRNELDNFKEKYATIVQIKQLQMDLDNLKYTSIVNHHNINTNKRGAYLFDSGPIGLLHSINKNVSRSISAEHETVSRVSDESTCNTPQQLSPLHAGNNEADVARSTVSSVSVPRCHRTSVSKNRVKQNNDSSITKSPTSKSRAATTNEQCSVSNPKDVSYASTARKKGIWKTNNKSDGWTIVQRKRLRNRSVGCIGKASAEPGVNFKAAHVKVPLFINYVSKEVTEKDISDYIVEKTKEAVQPQKMTMKMERHYNSFKVYVYKHNLHLYLDDNLWPNGINCTRFVRYKKPKKVRGDMKSLQKQLESLINGP